mmetsp:Transcript_32153/g.61869  ORF Transcript_32153/g.61869 Transcript_32153/m.61869 type:complete len:615 (+) Transcript_32153:261-2105(+)
MSAGGRSDTGDVAQQGGAVRNRGANRSGRAGNAPPESRGPRHPAAPPSAISSQSARADPTRARSDDKSMAGESSAAAPSAPAPGTAGWTPTLEDMPKARRDAERWVVELLEALGEARAEAGAARERAEAHLLEKEQTRVRMDRLEAEVQISNAARRAAEEAHHKEVDSFEAELMKAMQERSELRAHNQDMHNAEAQLIDLYLEMKDRHGMPAPSAAELEREAAGLRGQSPLVVVGMLRANLASLRDFKHSCEKELRRVQDRHTHEQSARTLELEGKVASLQKQLEQAEFEAAEALAKMKLATQRQDWTLSESRKLVGDANEEGVKLARMLEARERELRVTRAALEAATTEGRKRDDNVLKVIELEVTRERDIGTFRSDIKRYNVQIASMKKELKDIGAMNVALMAAKNKAEKELAAELARGRQRERSFHARRVNHMEEVAARLEKEVLRKDRLIARARSGLPIPDEDVSSPRDNEHVAHSPVLASNFLRTIRADSTPATPNATENVAASPQGKSSSSNARGALGGFRSKSYKPPPPKEDPMSRREKMLKERREVDDGIARVKMGEKDKKSIMRDFRNVMAAGDRRMLLPSWEDVEAGTAHQDESLRLDDVENDT